MIQKKHLYTISLLMIGFIAGWASSSFIPMHRFHKKDGPPPFAHFYKLGLSEETVQKIKTVHDEAGIEHKKLKEQLNQYEQQFHRDIETTKDEQKIRKSFYKFITHRTKLEEVRFATMTKVHKFLTLEQIQKLRSFGPPGPKHRRRK